MLVGDPVGLLARPFLLHVLHLDTNFPSTMGASEDEQKFNLGACGTEGQGNLKHCVELNTFYGFV